MENALYTTLTRQSGLMAEMQAVANNIANLSTTGFRAEGAIFAEYVAALDRGQDSLSMARAAGRRIDLAQGAMQPTGGMFDFAIEGDGFFLIQTPEGEALTRAGAFLPDPGEFATHVAIGGVLAQEHGAGGADLRQISRGAIAGAPDGGREAMMHPGARHEDRPAALRGEPDVEIGFVEVEPERGIKAAEPFEP